MNDIVLMRCLKCGWIHEAIYPHLDPAEDEKYTHCANCFADYIDFEVVTDPQSVNPRRYKFGLKILVD
jgi:hypothetical protein